MMRKTANRFSPEPRAGKTPHEWVKRVKIDSGMCVGGSSDVFHG